MLCLLLVATSLSVRETGFTWATVQVEEEEEEEEESARAGEKCTGRFSTVSALRAGSVLCRFAGRCTLCCPPVAPAGRFSSPSAGVLLLQRSNTGWGLELILQLCCTSLSKWVASRHSNSVSCNVDVACEALGTARTAVSV